MKRKYLLGLLGLSLMVSIGACSTSKLAQTSAADDDVYNSVAKAKELPKYEKKEQNYRTDEQLYGGGNYSDEYAYDDSEGEYESRLNRFYYNTPWRSSYYDNYYSYRYDPYFDYPFGFGGFYRPGLSFNLGFGSSWYDPYWGYSPYYSRYWGPYSYYNVYPGYGYGGGFYGGGYYRGGYYGRPVYASPNYRTRPSRETTITRGGSIYNNTPTRGTNGTSYGRPGRTVGAGRTSSTPGTSTEGRTTQPARPTRPSRTEEYRAPRESSSPRQEQSRPSDYSRPTRSSGSDGGNSGGSSSSGRSSGGSSSSGGSRPSRGGR